MTRPSVILLAILLATVPAVAQAQMLCGDRDDVIEMLEEDYGQARVGMGLSSPTEIFEIWASTATGTWSILKTVPNGITCILTKGDNWINTPPDDSTPIYYSQPKDPPP